MLPAIALAAATVASMQHHRRVLIVAASSPADPALAEQRRELAGWRSGAADRDISVVEVIGDHVAGASDTAAALRQHYRLAADRFQVVLIGKDGHEADRSTRPYPARALEATIDAMPMRRAGQR
jgi:metal-dependent amidase/aminoacylase/carboxypeptidase family protein